MMLPVFSIPVLSLALVAWAAVSRRLSGGVRRAIDGRRHPARVRSVDARADRRHQRRRRSDFHWRWTPTPEERLLAQARDEPLRRSARRAPAAAPAAPASPLRRPRQPLRRRRRPATPKLPTPRPPTAPRAAAPQPRTTRADWPGFRGPERDGVVRGVRIETDWSKSPPVELWRRPIGPGWSSFAVHGDRVYTQEQRGDDEIVSCYNLTTGEPVWRHRDAARFWESNGGAGPRGTPTLSNGRVYTLGATGIVNALDAAQRRRRLVAQRGDRHRREDPGLGLRELAAGRRRPRHRRRVRPARRPTTPPPASRAGSARPAAAGYSSPHLVDDRRRRRRSAAERRRRDRASRRPTARVLWEHAWERRAASCSRR